MIALFNLDVEVSPNRSPVKKKYNFYKDANVNEVRSSYNILEELKLSINNLLVQWPEHPVLKMVRIINHDFNST